MINKSGGLRSGELLLASACGARRAGDFTREAPVDSLALVMSRYYGTHDSYNIPSIEHDRERLTRSASYGSG